MNHWRILATFAVLITVPSMEAMSDDCAPYRLDQDGGPFSHIPVMAQGSLGLCFAYTTAELIDYYRFSHAPPVGDTDYNRLTSPIEAVLKYAKKPKPTAIGSEALSSIEGGDVCDSIDQWSGANVCDKNVVQDRYQGSDPAVSAALYQQFFNKVRDADKPRVASMNISETEEMLEDLLDWRDQYLDLKNKNHDDAISGFLGDIFGPSDAKKLLKKKLREATDGTLACTQEFAMDPKLLPDPKLVAKLIENGSPVDLLYALIANACKDHSFHIPKMSCEDGCNKSRGGITGNACRMPKEVLIAAGMANTDKDGFLMLRQGTAQKQAVGITYCSDVLKKGRGFYPNPEYGGICDADHASVVIGQRQKGGQCQYLIRNSWGTSCNGYSSDWNCEGGNIWVDRDSLEKVLDNVQLVSAGK